MTNEERDELVTRRAALMEQAKTLRTTIAGIEGRWQNARGPVPTGIERQNLEEIESETKAIDARLG